MHQRAERRSEQPLSEGKFFCYGEEKRCVTSLKEIARKRKKRI